MKQQTTAREKELSSSLRASIAVRIEGVLGELQRGMDGVMLREYPNDRAARERAVDAAQAELDAAEDDFDLGWAWHRLNEALRDLADFEARRRLARRREALREQQKGGLW